MAGILLLAGEVESTGESRPAHPLGPKRKWKKSVSPCIAWVEWLVGRVGLLTTRALHPRLEAAAGLRLHGSRGQLLPQWQQQAFPS